MSGGAAQRRQRILAVRVRQTRIAQVRLAEAHRKLERLEGTAEQLANMALSLTKSPGETSGLALRAIGEMGERLGTAAYQMRTPIADAAIERDQRLTDNILAERNESSAEKMTARATAQAERSREIRADANRPYRPRLSMLETEL